MYGAVASDRDAGFGGSAPAFARVGAALSCEADDLFLAIARDRDRSAFAALFHSYAPRLKTYLLRQGAPPALAEELVQEAMVLVWRKAALFDPARASASTWIFRIARNLRVDAQRRDRRHDGVPDLSEAPEPPQTPEGAQLVRQRDERVRTALSDLPADQAELLRLSFFQDRPHAEIAQQLNLPLGTVKSRIRRAVQQLRSALEDEA
jgi:RNA polymerase sigma-70 factor (ECF subfamily)